MVSARFTLLLLTWERSLCLLWHHRGLFFEVICFCPFFLQSGASSNKARHALSLSVGRMLASGKQHSLNRYHSTASRTLIFSFFFFFFIHEQLTGVSAVGGKIKGKSRAASEGLGKLAFVFTPPEWANVVNLRAVLWCCASWSPPIVAPAGYKQSQQNMSGVARMEVVVVEWRKMRAAGIGNDLCRLQAW